MLSDIIPEHLDIGTGLGKTAVLSIWLVARAFNHSLPSRLVYVVDRRAVVDQATKEADRLAARLSMEELVSLRVQLGLAEGRLPVSTLRGQHPDNEQWRTDPSLPAIIVGTVDMVGSRLLFEGYGVSRRMRPYHAALLGHDALVVLDEAHLVPPFEALMRQVAAGAATYGPSGRNLPRAPLRLLSLSATGRGGIAAPFRLDPTDYAHPVVARRLRAPKAIHIQPVPVARGALAVELAKLAWQRSESGRGTGRILIFCNSRDVAGTTETEILRLAGRTLPVQLLVGERRLHEREEAAKWLAVHGFEAGTDRTEASGPAFLIATSAGEVGVDLDADHMVCDLVAWERMVQRLGRVNRRGSGAAVVDVLTVAPEKSDAPTDHDHRAAACAEVLRRLPVLPDGGLDGSPGALAVLAARGNDDAELAALLRQATTPVPLRPALTRALVDAWSLTSLREHPGRPEIGPWLRGWEEQEPQTRMIWRRFLPWRADEREPRAAEVDAFFSFAGPQRIETLEAPVWSALELLRKRAGAIIAEVPGAGGRPAAVILSSAGERDGSLTLEQLFLFKNDDAFRDRTLVVDARLGGLSEGGLLDGSCGHEPTTIDGEAGLAADRLQILLHDAGEPAPAGWTRAHAWVSRFDAEGEATEEVVVYVAEAAGADPALARRNAQRLGDHAAAVERHARAIAARLGLAADQTEMLACAARLHDAGKARECWQTAFGAPEDGRPYAKTTAQRVDQSVLGGYRHEFGSLADAEADAGLLALPEDLRQLALHLIVAHHGLGRPLVPSIDPLVPSSVIQGRAGEVALRFAALQRRWGPWGLVWWEALLRAADILASRENDGEQV